MTKLPYLESCHDTSKSSPPIVLPWYRSSNFTVHFFSTLDVVPRTLVKDHQNWLNLSLKGIFFFRHLANWKLLLTLGRQHQKRIASFNEKTSRFDGKTWKQSQIICRIRNFLGIFLFIRSEIAVKPTLRSPLSVLFN